MTNEWLQPYLAFMSKVNEKIDEDQELGEAWGKIDVLLDGTDAFEGGSCGGLEDMIRSHFKELSEYSRSSISFIRDVDVADGQKGCIVLLNTPDAQEDHDYILSEEASYPYVGLEGKTYVSIELLDTILDCVRRGCLIDPNAPVIVTEDREVDVLGQKHPRHHGQRKRSAKKRRK